MKKRLKILISVLLFVSFISGIVMSDAIKETIEVYRNNVKLIINNTSVNTDNFYYNNDTYASVKEISQLLGAKLSWDKGKNTISVSNDYESASSDYNTIALKDLVNPYDIQIDLSEYGIAEDQVDAYKLEKADKMLNKILSFHDGCISIPDPISNIGGNSLDLNSEYTLTIYTKDSQRYKISFKTSKLPEISESSNRQIILIPAMPEKGFDWPYYIVLPTKRDKSEYKHDKRYLMVDTTNNGVTFDFNTCLNSTYSSLDTMDQHSIQLAEELYSPMLMPVFPRPDVWYYTKEDGGNAFYTHALDRDTATLHLKLKDKNVSDMLTGAFSEQGFDVNQFIKIDNQLDAMMTHAIDYLNSNGFELEERVFMCGYSASGQFTDRFAILHPDRVKAVASGAALDDMVLPLDSYKGKNLIFPLGTSDYKDITGHAFDIKTHNKVAKLIYMGEDDTNNVVPYSDCYGDLERDTIVDLWGMDVLPRAIALTKLYGEAGGKGIFILDKGVQHGSSRDMDDYLLEFFTANIDSNYPAYPIPKDPKQLKYTLFK